MKKSDFCLASFRCLFLFLRSTLAKRATNVAGGMVAMDIMRTRTVKQLEYRMVKHRLLSMPILNL